MVSGIGSANNTDIKAPRPMADSENSTDPEKKQKSHGKYEIRISKCETNIKF